MENASDNELIIRAKNGDNACCEALIDRYKNLAKKISRRYFLTGADEDDIYQEAMIGLFKGYLNYKISDKSDFKKFASLCINRQIQTAIKTANRQKNKILSEAISLNNQGGFKIADEEDDEGIFYIIPSNAPMADEDLITKETLGEVLDQINKLLSEYEKQILFLYLDGQSYKEIALAQEKSVKSVENALTRIKSKISLIKSKSFYFEN